MSGEYQRDPWALVTQVSTPGGSKRPLRAQAKERLLSAVGVFPSSRINIGAKSPFLFIGVFRFGLQSRVGSRETRRHTDDVRVSEWRHQNRLYLSGTPTDLELYPGV